MLRYIHNNDTVRIPVHEQGRLYQYRKLCSEFLLEEGREPTNREISHYLGLDAAGVYQLKRAAKTAVVKSLDAPAPGGGEGTALSDTVADPEDAEGMVLDKSVGRTAESRYMAPCGRPARETAGGIAGKVLGGEGI